MILACSLPDAAVDALRLETTTTTDMATTPRPSASAAQAGPVLEQAGL
jgi:hypothetical protein